METHAHHHHVHQITSLNSVYMISILLNLLFVVAESAVGFWSGSLGLLSDAGHNLSDVFGLLLAMVAFRLSSSHATRRFTYGYRKASVLISLVNALILLVAVGAIVLESIRKFKDPGTVDGGAVSWTAAAGIAVNGLTAVLLMKQQKHDINTRGAFLHTKCCTQHLALLNAIQLDMAHQSSLSRSLCRTFLASTRSTILPNLVCHLEAC